MHIYKSKSAISFNEFKKQINEHHDFENDWGFYIDIDNINNNNDNEFKENQESIYIQIFNKYYVLISIGISILIILII
jgi:hypothetical protein